MYLFRETYQNENDLSRYKKLKFSPRFLYPYIVAKEYKRCLGCNLNLKSPEKFSEKLQYIKLNNKNKLKNSLTDKIQLKKYISEKIPDLKTAPIYQIFDNADDIDFKNLPNEFVLKTNHAWKTNIYIENKNILTEEQIENIKNYYRHVTQINFAYWSFYELQYKDIVPKIFAEESYGDLWSVKQYEVWCFNGKPEFISVNFSKMENNQSSYHTYIYDCNWNKENFGIYSDIPCDEISKPDNIDKILKYAIILSEDFDFVRVDFAVNNDKNILYLNELTFTPYSGFILFTGENQDLYYGNKLRITKGQS